MSVCKLREKVGRAYAAMLLRQTFAVAVLWITLSKAQDCDIVGPRLGDGCTVHADCNTGPCPIVHSSCTADLVCDCTVGLYGDVGTRNCSKLSLGDECLSNKTCYSTTRYSECVAGFCACGYGYYEQVSRLEEQYCSPVRKGTPCTVGEEGDAFCASGDPNGQMVCTLGKCACFEGMVTRHDIFTCVSASPDLLTCAACINTGGSCYRDNGTNVCSCSPTKYSSIGDAMVTGCDTGRAPVSAVCQEEGYVTCGDPHSVCTHSSQMTDRCTCKCKKGYVRGPAWGDPTKFACHAEVSTREDPNCEQCNVNGGRCYDLDDDRVHDVCQCPYTRSTSNENDYGSYCDTVHLNVTCDSDSMTVCYTPHNTDEFPDIDDALDSGESIMFVTEKLHDKNCHLVRTADGWCIDLEYGTFLSCDTKKVVLNERITSYTNWIILQRQPNKRTVSDMYIYAYCFYDSLVHSHTGHVSVALGEPPEVSADGDEVQAGVSLHIVDEYSNSADGVILGQSVQLVATITDDKDVFREIKPEVCVAANMPDLSSPFTRTTLIVHEGCPVANNLLDQHLLFSEDIGNSKTTRSSFFTMFKFDDSDYVFFHCALRVCMVGNTEECNPSVCVRRKRRSENSETARLSSEEQEEKLKLALQKFTNTKGLQISAAAVRVRKPEQEPTAAIPHVPDLSSREEDRQVEKQPLVPYPGDHYRDDVGTLANASSIALFAGGGFFVLMILTVLVLLTAMVCHQRRDFSKSFVEPDLQVTYL